MMLENRFPIYLHMMDRELRNSVNFNPRDLDMLQYIETAFLLTLDKPYVSNSLLWENLNLFPRSIGIILQLEKNNVLQLLSNYPTINEFIQSRRHMYEEDYQRYPMYFNDSDNNKPWGTHVLYHAASTTKWLHSQLHYWAGDSTEKVNPDINNTEKKKEIQEIVLQTLFKRDGRAITYSLFHNKNNMIETEYYIRRLISFLYTQRYMELMGGTILTGIEGLTVFDKLVDEREAIDYELNRKVLQAFALISNKQLSLEEHAAELIMSRMSPNFEFFLLELKGYLRGVYYLVDENGGNQRHLNLKRVTMGNFIEDNLSTVLKRIPEGGNKLERAHLTLLSLNDSLKIKYRAFQEGYDQVKSRNTYRKVLIVTATDTELRALIRAFNAQGISYESVNLDDFSYLNFGKIGKVYVSVIKTEMGSSGTGGSALTMKYVKQYIQPDFVISAGIAFGLRKGKQQIGDILVSRQLKNYEPAKVTKGGEISRGDKMPANSNLLQRFSYSSLERKEGNVHVGLILSGEKLVNSEEFVKKLLSLEPEAIGGEMEGAGLVSACHVEQMPWILVKGICDWGYDKGDDYQQIVAENTMEYVVLTLKNFF